MQAQNAVAELNINVRNLSDYDCVPCIMAKAKGMTYQKLKERVKVPLQKRSMDVWSVEETAIDGSTMVLLIVDEATRYKWAFPMTKKDEAKIHISTLVRLLNNAFE
jgi:hypothetical protein